MKHTFFFIFFLLLLVACSKVDSDIRTVEMTVSAAENFELDDFTDNIEFIVLGNGIADSTVQFNRMDRTYFAQNRFVVLDRSIGDYYDLFIKVFDADGQYNTKYYIGGYGESPFKVIKDLWTDGKRILLLDYGRAGIWTGEMTDKPSIDWTLMPIGEGFDKFFPLGGNKYVLDADNSPSALMGTANLGTFSLTSEKAVLIDTAVSIPPYFLGVGIAGSRFAPDRANHNLYYSPSSGLDLYKIDKTGVINLAARTNLGSNTFDFAANASLSQPKFLEMRRDQSHIIGFDQVVVHNHNVLCQFRYDNRFYWLIFSLEDGTKAMYKPNFPFVEYFKTSYTPIATDVQGRVYFRLQKNELWQYAQENPLSQLSQKISSVERMDDREGVVLMRIPMDLLFD